MIAALNGVLRAGAASAGCDPEAIPAWISVVFDLQSWLVATRTIGGTTIGVVLPTEPRDPR